jgi:hypothetical protein
MQTGVVAEEEAVVEKAGVVARAEGHPSVCFQITRLPSSGSVFSTQATGAVEGLGVTAERGATVVMEAVVKIAWLGMVGVMAV